MDRLRCRNQALREAKKLIGNSAKTLFLSYFWRLIYNSMIALVLFFFLIFKTFFFTLNITMQVKTNSLQTEQLKRATSAL